MMQTIAAFGATILWLSVFGIIAEVEATSLPQYYGLYLISNGEVEAIPEAKTLSPQPTRSLSKRPEFLLFDKNIASLYPNMHLLKMKYVRQSIEYVADETCCTRHPEITPVSEWQVQYSLGEVPLAVGPVTGQSEMVKVIPAKDLEDGAYLLELIALPTEQLFFSPSFRFPFLVNIPAEPVRPQDCVDYITGTAEQRPSEALLNMLRGPRVVPCKESITAAPQLTPQDIAQISGTYRGESAKAGAYLFPLIGQRVRDDGYAVPGSDKFNGAFQDRNLTCKAAVYAMIARGVGYSDATIDEFWRDDDLAYWNDEVVRGKAGAAVTFEPDPPIDENAKQIGNFSEVIQAILAGQPVMIHGTVDGNPYGHWMLATAVTPAGLIANDPWEKRQVTIDLTTRKIIDPPGHELAKSFKADAYVVVKILQA